MRTIKFRGKCAKGSRYAGEWAYGSCVQCEKSDDVLITAAINDRCSCTYHVDPDTVGQYTGLTDKNGREIYEGDFINYDGSTWGGVVQWHHNGYFFINDSYGKKYPNCVRYRALGDMLDGRPLVVVGNIHDNPELIKKGGNDESDVH